MQINKLFGVFLLEMCSAFTFCGFFIQAYGLLAFVPVIGTLPSMALIRVLVMFAIWIVLYYYFNKAYGAWLHRNNMLTNEEYEQFKKGKIWSKI